MTEAFERVEDTAVVLANLEIPDESVLAAAEAAAARGAVLIVNPAPARTLPSRLLDLRPTLTPNADEVRRLTGADAEAGAALLHERTGAPVIATLGADGALLVHGGGLVKIPALRVQVADTTGAGDVFNGTLAGELALGTGLEAASTTCGGAGVSVDVPGWGAGSAAAILMVRLEEGASCPE